MDVTGRATAPRTRPGLAVVLGSGGSPGHAFIIGALDGLEKEAGFSLGAADLIVGTSAGALIAGSVAPAQREARPELIGCLKRLDNSRQWRRRWWDRPTAAVRQRAGLVVAAAARQWRGRANVLRVSPPPHHPGAVAVSVDVTAAHRVCHRLVEAPNSDLVLRASTAVPFVTRPVRIDGHDHLDGALHSVSNADAPGAGDAELLIVICPGVPRRGGGLRGLVARAVLRQELHARTDRGEATVVVSPDSLLTTAPRDGEVASRLGRAVVSEMFAPGRRGGATGPA